MIFDVARVILTFEPAPFLESIIPDGETRRQVMTALFKSPRWLELDRGNIEPVAALEAFCEENPTLAPHIRRAWEEWHGILRPIPETVAFIRELRKKGCRLYFLSNLHKHTAEFVLQTFPEIWRLFDGGIFSCHTGFIKPETEIFRLLLSRYGLQAGESLYIDDNRENVQAAQKLGMEGVWFTSPAELARARALVK